MFWSKRGSATLSETSVNRSTNSKNEEETFENLSSNDHCPSYFSSMRKIWWNNIRSELKMKKTHKNLMKNKSK